MKITIAYTEVCLPDYFSGDARPWVTIYPTEKGYTSRELRKAILSEFAQGAIGGSDPVAFDYIRDENNQKRADKFYKKLPSCLNREIKYRGKKHKYKDYGIKIKDDSDWDVLPLLHVVFNIED